MTGINKEYTPRTAIIRGYYATSAAFGGDVVDAALQFNRWLHAHDAEIRAAALAESEGELAATRSMAERASLTLALIAQLDISATKSIEDLVAPWRRIDA